MADISHPSLVPAWRECRTISLDASIVPPNGGAHILDTSEKTKKPSNPQPRTERIVLWNRHCRMSPRYPITVLYCRTNPPLGIDCDRTTNWPSMNSPASIRRPSPPVNSPNWPLVRSCHNRSSSQWNSVTPLSIVCKTRCSTYWKRKNHWKLPRHTICWACFERIGEILNATSSTDECACRFCPNCRYVCAREFPFAALNIR